MKRVGAILMGVWEFVVGDDWWTAVGVVAALGVIALLVSAGASAWWAMPPAVIGLLVLSIYRALREHSRH